MDPRHGEISRAMRNRGIELCILDKLDLKPGSQDILDVKSLMTNIGVCNHSIQDTLIKIHNAVCNMLPGELNFNFKIIMWWLYFLFYFLNHLIIIAGVPAIKLIYCLMFSIKFKFRLSNIS